MKNEEKYAQYENMLPMLVQKDVNLNVTMFLFVMMFRLSNIEQKEAIVTFAEGLYTDMETFFIKRAEFDFELNEKEIATLTVKVQKLLKQNLDPVLQEIEQYKNDKQK